MVIIIKKSLKRTVQEEHLGFESWYLKKVKLKILS